MAKTATLATMFFLCFTVSAEGTQPEVRVGRLEAFIIKRQPKAKPYARLLSQRIFIEAKRHGLDPAMLAAISWVESDYRKGLRGASHEIGVWQLRPVDHGMGDGLAWLRAHASEFPVVGSLPSKAWKRLRWKYRLIVLDDIKAGTYLAAYSIKRHMNLCRRMRHRVGQFVCNKPFIRDCPRYHRYEIDRACHYNSGVSWCKSAYLHKLRKRTRNIRRVLGMSTRLR